MGVELAVQIIGTALGVIIGGCVLMYLFTEVVPDDE